MSYSPSLPASVLSALPLIYAKACAEVFFFLAFWGFVDFIFGAFDWLDSWIVSDLLRLEHAVAGGLCHLDREFSVDGFEIVEAAGWHVDPVGSVVVGFEVVAAHCWIVSVWCEKIQQQSLGGLSSRYSFQAFV
jgi:hypothetical protein